MATVYVSKSGNDSNNGTAGAPVLTLGKAFDLVRVASENGSQVIVQDNGVYQEAGLGSNVNNGGGNVVVNDLIFMALTGSDGLPSVSPTVQGSGSSIQSFAVYCDQNWTIKGITFKDFIINNGNGVLTIRGIGAASDDGLKVELCTFHNITGSCVYLDNGTDGNDPGYHIVNGNTFYNVNTGGSGSAGAVIQLTSTKDRKIKILNNVFYDWQPRGLADNLIQIGGAGNTKRPECIISHNTFGTSSVEAASADIVIPHYAVESQYAKFEYNIMTDQTNQYSFADIANGEANYNIYFNLTSTSDATHAPFGAGTAPTGSTANLNADPILKGPFVGSDANYRLGGTTSPAFDAAIGSTGVSKDRTGRLRAILDETALNTGIFDIGAFEATGLFSDESPDTLPQVSGDFTINRIPNADNQNKRGLQEGNSSVLGSDVDQVPFITALNGAIPTLIRKRPSTYIQESGKKTKG